ncbi:MAG: mechanosensitive ion channel [Deltaproteobacteria bacterium]|jgi:small-conductance mechanosensitive channel|nr:mechanosensitive ion channel [Deltaproteobacteria bacterium]
MRPRINEHFFVFIVVLGIFFWIFEAGLWTEKADSQTDNASAPAAASGENSSAPDEAPAESADTPPLPEVPLPDLSTTNPAEDEALLQLWRDRILVLNQQAAEASGNLNEALGSGGQLNTDLVKANTERNRLMRLFQISRGYPAQQEDILRQIQGLRTQVAGYIQPLELQKTALTQKLDEVDSLQKDLDGVTFRDENSAATPQNNLEQAKKLFEDVDKKLTAVLGPGQALYTNLDQTVQGIEKNIPQTWLDYYFTTLADSGQGIRLAANSDQIFKWVRSLASMSLFIYPQTAADWLGALVKFLVTILIAFGLAAVIRRSSAKYPPAWKEALTKIVKGPWLWLSFGLALIIGGQNPLGGSYLVLKLPGMVMFLGGLGALSWRLRMAAVPKLEGQSSPLSRFYPPAAIGMIFLFLDCPAGPMTVVWVLVQIVFLFWLRHNKKNSSRVEMTFLESLAFGSAFYFALTSLLVAVFGYPRMAILVFMLLFTLVNIMILASALISLGSMLSDSNFAPEKKPIQHAIVQSLAIPLAFLLSLACAIPWLWAVPGSEYLLKNIMQKGYTVGDASFELSRVLFIAILFFLFRSLVAFGRTSLEQLPQTFQGIGKGVVPPLQALFTYLTWAIFLIIALALVGVNFTSLAVVGGGLGVGIGLGLQSLFSNLVSGLMLMFGRSLMVGDLVEVGGIIGTVKSINIRSTVVETAEKAVVYVPNSSIMSGQFTNWTSNHRRVRRTLTVQTCYGIDIPLALKIMKEVAMVNDKVVTADTPLAVLSNFGDNSLIFSLFVTIVDIDLSASILSSLRMEIEKRFNSGGITIYNPSLEVNLVGSQPPQSAQEPSKA